MKTQTKCKCGRPLDRDRTWFLVEGGFLCSLCWRRAMITVYEEDIQRNRERIATMKKEIRNIEKKDRAKPGQTRLDLGPKHKQERIM